MLQACSQLAPVLHGTTLPAASYGCTITQALPVLPPQQGQAAAPLCLRMKLCPPCQPMESQCQHRVCQLPSEQQRCPLALALTANSWLEGGGLQAGGAQPGRDGGTQSSSMSPSEQPRRQALRSPHPVPAPRQAWQGHTSPSTAPWTRWVPMLLSNDALELISSLPRSCYQASSATSTPCFQPGVDRRWL